ncbi:3-hydroxyisobutyrate dehydrogenase [Rubrobacter xylanophilus]|uniref:3-hydroxyisobutyrate dehydrogenase n=1 Tax=Rubrobacter xylanophilus TaxID=49319 RepID=A0A510HPU8_9ACTN|nr:NAD(P)-dependent oxidoreductase [Rubrobacter xylanophilus]BBL80973.1 3-hydroxyisobutyrate dehydrogenase [Rubrobacter xylanophilus]
MSGGGRIVTVLGTGIMGSAMARNLLEAGMEVRVWNRTREKAEPLAAEGARVADSPRGAARGADILITMLADADAVERAVGEGVLETLAPGAVWLQTSTVGIEGTRRLQRIALEQGVAYVDAPVLGTREPAEAGELVVLASGPEEVRPDCEPVFEAIGKKTLWVGPVGAGTRLKLVVNGWITGLLGVLGETFALAERLGVDPSSFFEAVEGGPLDLPYARVKGKMMAEREYPTSFSVRLARKDVALILEAAGSLRLPVCEAVAYHLDRAAGAGHAEEDMAALYEGVRAVSG